MNKLSLSKILQLVGMGIIVAVLIVANIVAGIFGDMITVYFGGYGLDTSKIDATKSEAVCERIEAEGIVLLKNEGDLLPLKDTTKVNVFGWSAIDPVYSGGGSGSSNSLKRAVTFLDGLTNNGFTYNTELIDFYKEYKKGREDNNYWSQSYPYLNLIEPQVTQVEPLIGSAKAFSDTAIVFIARLGGEHQDIPKTQVKWKGTEDTSRTYLDITVEEEDLLSLVCDNFQKVIVITNSTNTMNLSFMDDAKIKAGLSVGAFGQYGGNAIAKVLKGDVTPSGKTADTYAYDFATNPTYANSPDGQRVNTDKGSVKTYKDSYTNGSKHYIDYAENIYVGYKWYETADAEDYWRSQGGYEKVVQYPFGYGMSYTDFEWNLLSITPSNGATITDETEITVKLNVTNVGNLSGKDVVQLYFGGQYVEGGIEKSSKNLIAFAKTTELEATGGEKTTQLVTLTFTGADLKSYDCYNKSGLVSNGGYVLDKGEYKFYISTDAHNVKDAENMTFSYNVEETIVIEKDEVTNNKVENLFTGDNALDAGISVDGANTDQNILYLTRENFEDTFPIVEARRNRGFNLDQNFLCDYSDTDVMPTQGVAGNLSLTNEDNSLNMELISKLGSNYNDPAWESLLNQITNKELIEIVEGGGYRTVAVESIGKPEVIDLDGPQGINDTNMTQGSTNVKFTFYPSETVLAQTWSVELSYTYGLNIAYEAGQANVSGWYAPAVDLHRTPFGGRNFEYYSEDAYLSGKMAANTIAGATNNGLYCYVKHFAVNETASNGQGASSGMYTWLTEQAMRENYLKGFEIAIKEGGANAVMAAYSNVGAVTCTGSYALLTGVLRTEWGFKGTVITDYSDGSDACDPDQGLRAGTDMWLAGARAGLGSFNDKTSATAVSCMRRAAKNVIYTYCNTLYRQANYDPAEGESQFAVEVSNRAAGDVAMFWVLGVVAIDVVAMAGVGFWAYMVLFKKTR